MLREARVGIPGGDPRRPFPPAPRPPFPCERAYAWTPGASCPDRATYSS